VRGASTAIEGDGTMTSEAEAVEGSSSPVLRDDHVVDLAGASRSSVNWCYGVRTGKWGRGGQNDSVGWPVRNYISGLAYAEYRLAVYIYLKIT
jgi:hypothetical protein